MMNRNSTTQPDTRRHLASTQGSESCFLDTLPVLALAQQKSAPTKIQIFPKGPQLSTRDGRKFKLSDPDAFVERFNAAAKPLLVDYDHLSHFDPDEGGSSKAAGWINTLEVRNGEVWASVEWTATATAQIENREYRFISPEFIANRKTSEIVGIDAAALVNRPAFEMSALARRQTTHPNGETDMKAIATVLGLAEDATEDDILAAIKKRNGELETATTELASVKAKIKTPSTDDFMPRADYDAVLARAEKAEKAVTDTEEAAFKETVTASIDQAVAEGKITPGTKNHYIGLCSDQASLDKVLAAIGAAPKVIGQSGITGKPDETTSQLTAVQKDMAATLGISEADYLKQVEADAAT